MSLFFVLSNPPLLLFLLPLLSNDVIAARYETIPKEINLSEVCNCFFWYQFCEVSIAKYWLFWMARIAVGLNLGQASDLVYVGLELNALVFVERSWQTTDFSQYSRAQLQSYLLKLSKINVFTRKTSDCWSHYRLFLNSAMHELHPKYSLVCLASSCMCIPFQL